MTFLLLASGMGLFVARRAIRRRRRLARLGRGPLPHALAEAHDADAAQLLRALSEVTQDTRRELAATLQQGREYAQLHGQLGQNARTPLWLRVEAEALDHGALLTTRALLAWRAAVESIGASPPGAALLAGADLDLPMQLAERWISRAPETMEELELLAAIVDALTAFERDLASRRQSLYR